MSALSASALSAAEQPAIYSEEGRALKKRLELKKKLEKRRAEEAAAALGYGRREKYRGASGHGGRGG